MDLAMRFIVGLVFVTVLVTLLVVLRAAFFAIYTNISYFWDSSQILEIFTL